MRGFTRTLVGGIIAGAALFAGHAQAQDISAELFASGLVRPVLVTHAPGDFDRVFIVEQRAGSTGRIRIADIDTGAVSGTPFFSVSVSTASEQGLLGLAFHPDYQNNGLFYVNYTNPAGNTVIDEYEVNGDPATATTTNVASRRQIMTIGQPFSNHNGGWIGFSPIDGYLYIATGDGGSGNDPGNRAQNLNNLLGKMLRVDVDGDDFPIDAGTNYAIPADNPFVGVSGRDEIWAYGLRNPYRCSFDAETGDLWIGDVGQSAREEVNAQPAASTGGENYGWRCKEGNLCTGLSGCICSDPTLTDPIRDYVRSGGQCSVIGGYVYRGCLIPELKGTYFHGDYCSTAIWTFKPNASLTGFTEFTNRTSQLEPAGSPTIGLISSFGEDAYGELYITDLSDGQIFRIVPTDPTPRTDCNNNGIEDECEIRDGSGDADGNGVIDECEVDLCIADFDGDGDVDLTDFGVFGAAFGSMTGDPNYNPDADFDNDGDVDLTDFGVFGSEFGRTDCPI